MISPSFSPARVFGYQTLGRTPLPPLLLLPPLFLSTRTRSPHILRGTFLVSLTPLFSLRPLFPVRSLIYSRRRSHSSGRSRGLDESTGPLRFSSRRLSPPFPRERNNKFFSASGDTPPVFLGLPENEVAHRPSVSEFGPHFLGSTSWARSETPENGARPLFARARVFFTA